MKTFIMLLALTVSPLWARETPKTMTMINESTINKVLKEAHGKYKGLDEGKNADYIPALKKVDSDLFGIVIVTVDGKVFEVGDVKKEFSIQSISKVFTMANVMQASGDDKVIDAVGVIATGDVFNSIKAIENNKGHNMNPFVNPGAIATTSMVKGKSADEVWTNIMGTLNAFAGRELSVNQEVYKSESDTNQRNRAISALMHAYGQIKEKPEQAVDLYTRQCSVNVSAKDLAIMGATLANGGFNPVTKKQVIEQKHVQGILAVMATAGLYDTTGNWMYETGLPAKSGVGGGLMAVSPGKFGVAVFSPRLDEAGNSVRGQKAIDYITEKVNGNPYDIEPQQSSVIGDAE